MLSWQSPRNRPRSGTHASQARATLGADGLDSPTRQNPTDQKRTQGGKPSLVWRCKQAREGATEVHEPTNILQAQGPRSLWLVWALRVAGWQALQAVPRRITIHCIHAALSPDPLPGRVAGGQHDARCDFFHAAPVAESHRPKMAFFFLQIQAGAGKRAFAVRQNADGWSRGDRHMAPTCDFDGSRFGVYLLSVEATGTDACLDTAVCCKIGSFQLQIPANHPARTLSSRFSAMLYYEQYSMLNAC